MSDKLAEVARHSNFLYDYVDDGRISIRTANLALKMLNLLLGELPGLPVPDAAIGPEREVYQIWKNDSLYLSLTTFESGECDYFYMAGGFSAIKELEGEKIPAELIELLRVLTPPN